MIWQTVATLLLWFSFGGISQANSEPLFVEAVDYTTIDTVEGCRETRYRGKPRKYSNCLDSKKLYETAIAFAQKNRMPLLVSLGYDECEECEDRDYKLLDPDMIPTNKTISAALTTRQKTEFADFTNGTNQLAFLRMNSNTSHLFNTVQHRAEIDVKNAEIVHTWMKPSVPMWVMVNPKTNESNSVNYSRTIASYCTLGEELALSLQDVGVIKTNPNARNVCYMPLGYSLEDMEIWSQDCEKLKSPLKCYWAAKALEIESLENSKSNIHSKAQLNMKKSSEYFSIACKEKLATACHDLGFHLSDGETFPEPSIKPFMFACDNMVLNACLELAAAYQEGDGGLIKSLEIAIRLTAQGCDAHDPYACSILAEMALKNYPAAQKYQTKAETYLNFGCKNEISWACDLLAKK